MTIVTGSEHPILIGQWQEGKSRKPVEGETPEEAKARDQEYVVVERYQLNVENFNRLRALRYRFRAIFGSVAEQPFTELDQVLLEIFSAAKSLAYYWPRLAGSSGELARLRLAAIDKYEAHVWEMDSATDPLAAWIQAAMDGIERVCRPIIQDAAD